MASTVNVLISGAGMGGLMLAICLEKANINYQIYERAHQVRPLGSAISISPNLAWALRQLGLYDEIAKASKVPGISQVKWEKDLKLVGTIDYRGQVLKHRYGDEGFLITRPELYEIMLRHVPKEKLHYGKKLMTVDQDSNDQKAIATFEDGAVVEADLIVGADGVYSNVRKSLYNTLQFQNKLPLSDLEPMDLSSSCLVGIARNVDSVDCPELDLPYNSLELVMAEDKTHIWSMFTLKSNQIAWMVIKDIPAKDVVAARVSAKEEWSNYKGFGKEEMMAECRNFKTPYGGKLATLGDLIDKTDPGLITKVFLEQKLFETWYHGRVVLIGDACHKMAPHRGQGAVQSFMDAISLANQLNELKENNVQAFSKAFEEYKKERFDIAKEVIKATSTTAKLCGKGWIEAQIQWALLQLPLWLKLRMSDSLLSIKPQLRFLEFYPDEGTLKNSLNLTYSKRMAPTAKDSRDDSLLKSDVVFV